MILLVIGVIVLQTVAEFRAQLERAARSDLDQLIALLESYGHALSMPHAKPLGGGLWELRRTGKPQIRILYGFCGGSAVLVHAVKKERSALRNRDIALAKKRPDQFCGT